MGGIAVGTACMRVMRFFAKSVPLFAEECVVSPRLLSFRRDQPHLLNA
jgi:hypothetical protein